MIGGKGIVYSLVRRNGMLKEMQSINSLLQSGLLISNKGLMLFSTIKGPSTSTDKKPLFDTKHK